MWRPMIHSPWNLASNSSRLRQAMLSAFVFTRAHPTRAPTLRIFGAAPEICWQLRPLPAKRPTAGSGVRFCHARDDHAGNDLRRLLSHRRELRIRSGPPRQRNYQRTSWRPHPRHRSTATVCLRTGRIVCCRPTLTTQRATALTWFSGSSSQHRDTRCTPNFIPTESKRLPLAEPSSASIWSSLSPTERDANNVPKRVFLSG